MGSSLIFHQPLPGSVKPASTIDLECPLLILLSAFLTEAKTHPSLLGPPASVSYDPRLSFILLSSLQALVQVKTLRKKGLCILPKVTRSEGAGSNSESEMNSAGPVSCMRAGILSWSFLVSAAPNIVPGAAKAQ